MVSEPQADPTPRLESVAKKFGCPRLVALQRPTTPEQIQYLDLLPRPGRPELLPQAVAEFQGRPVLYFLDGLDGGVASDLVDADIAELQQRLANRSEHACLAVVRPGELVIYPINLDRKQLSAGAWQTITVADPQAPFLFQSLASNAQNVTGHPEKSDPVFAEIHDLLKRATLALASPRGPLEGLDVLSITGRALFFRFLLDRQIVRTEDLALICPPAKSGDLRDVFTDSDKAAATSVWLDETFNGNLLPLVEGMTSATPRDKRLRAYRKAYDQAGKTTGNLVFRHLEAILRGWKHVGGGAFQQNLPQIDWHDLNFAHIPVGVLSQVYETFSHSCDTLVAEDTSVHYTPKNIARLVVEQSLSGLPKTTKPRVLDPACGAGVFLVLAFRELVRLRWLNDGVRPGKAVIHDVLYNQLCGFDISESALRLSALALYITAIELNAITRPPNTLKVERDLRNRVLFNFAPANENERKRGFVLGSLASSVPADFAGAFDIVLGNPPWTRLEPAGDSAEAKKRDRARITALNEEFTAIGRRVLTQRTLMAEAAAYENPVGVPDLPFIWRATEWAKKDGIVAMALHARLILTQSDIGVTARNALFKGLTVTGLLNGSDLEETKVWPNMKMPWLLLWAKNSRPPPDHSFHFLTPIRENSLCEKGEFRIDYQSAYQVPLQSTLDRSWLLKALGLGTTFDVEVMDKLVAAASRQSVGTFWRGKLVTHRGFSLAPRPKNIAPDWLLKLPVFKPDDDGALPGFKDLQTFEEAFGRQAPYQTCGEETYQGPLLIIPQKPGEDRDTPKAYRVKTSCCFTQSFYGYSGGKHPDANLCLAILQLIVHSNLFRHFCLMRSSRIGASYRTFIKSDLDAFPFPDLVTLSAETRRKILALADSIETQAKKPWGEIDLLVAKFYQLSKAEFDVVDETIQFSGPYRVVRQPAAAPPASQELTNFTTTLEESLQPFFKIVRQKVAVTVVPHVKQASDQPWRFVLVQIAGDDFSPEANLLTRLMRKASEHAASRVIMPVPGGGLLMGMLNQRRLWTSTRARLCALHITREHLDRHFPVAN